MKRSLIALFIIPLFSFNLFGQYVPVEHKGLPYGVIPVEGPGSYDQPGATYMLTGNIASIRSTIFLGKDVTLDLNGYTLTYADGDYEHIPNFGFEEKDGKPIDVRCGFYIIAV